MSLTSSEEKRNYTIGSDEILAPGSKIGRYEIQRLQDTPGFSCVYHAVDTHNGREVALKVLLQRLASSEKHVERLRREYEALKRMQHRNIVDVLDFGVADDGRPYLVVEWCGGVTIESLLRQGAFSVDEALPIIRQLASAVQEIHEVGVVHRDIKSANVILLPTEGQAPLLKLIDFGIAAAAVGDQTHWSSHSSSEEYLGTPYGVAPEQINREHLDERTDVYSLGVLVYELLTGQKPFTAISTAEIVDMHLHLPPPRASRVAPVSPLIDGVIQRCMAKAREDRFASVGDFLLAFEDAASQPSLAAKAVPDPMRAVGLLVSLDFTCAEYDVLDEDFDRLDELLNDSYEECAAAGLRAAVESGTSLLAVSVLSDSPSQQVAQRQAALDTARGIANRFATETTGNVRLLIRLHVGEVETEFCEGVTSFVGGSLLSTGEWGTVDDDSVVVATTVTLRDLDVDSEQVPNRPGYVRVLS